MHMIIVGGFLGSVKATIISHLVEELNSQVVILENKFGKIGIDSNY